MITLPPRTQKLPKVCRECKTPVDKKTGVVRQGYLIRLCKPCARIKSNKYNEKRKKAKAGSWF